MRGMNNVRPVMLFTQRLYFQSRQTITALGSTVQYIRGALASLPFLGFLAPEESGSEEQPVRATRL